MVVIRLARTGRKKLALFRIVAADKRKAATGKFIEVLGRYNPHTKELVIDKKKIIEWMGKGAQPSNRVLVLLKKEGLKLPNWASIKTFDKPKKLKEKDSGKEENTSSKPDEKKKAQADDSSSKPEESKEEKQERVAMVATEESDKDETKAEEVKDEIETPAEAKKEKADKENSEAIAENSTQKKSD